MLSLILTGDINNTLNVSASAAAVGGKLEKVTIAGLESHGSFDHYIVNDGGTDMHLYVQNVQLV